MILIGHGVSYIPTISYINIRASKTSPRLFKISVPHVLYLLGVAIGATVTVNRTHISNPIYLYRADKQYINHGISLIISIISGIIIIGYAINEVCHHFMPNFNYKMSLDDNIERENQNCTIFSEKLFQITENDNSEQDANFESQTGREFTLICFSILSKALSLIYFYFPFIYLNFFVSSSLSSSDNCYVIHWLGFAGVVLSCLYIGILNRGLKGAFVISCIGKIALLIAMTIATNRNFPDNPVLKIFLYISFICFGFGYSYADLFCIETVSLKYTELVLAVGYAGEILAIGAIQYSVITDFDDWFCFETKCPNVDNILKHSLAFMIFAAVLMIISLFVLPRLQKMSVLETKNVVYRNKITMLGLRHRLVQPTNPEPHFNPQAFYQAQSAPYATNPQLYPQSYQQAPNQLINQGYPQQHSYGLMQPPIMGNPYQQPHIGNANLPPPVGNPHQQYGGIYPVINPPQMGGYSSNIHVDYRPEQPPAYSETEGVPGVSRTSTSKPELVDNSLEKQTKIHYSH